MVEKRLKRDSYDLRDASKSKKLKLGFYNQNEITEKAAKSI